MRRSNLLTLWDSQVSPPCTHNAPCRDPTFSLELPFFNPALVNRRTRRLKKRGEAEDESAVAEGERGGASREAGNPSIPTIL